MPKRLGGKSFERDLSRIRVTMGNALLPGVNSTNYPNAGGTVSGTNNNFIPVMAGYNYTGGTQIYVGETVFSISPAIGLDPTNDLEGTGSRIVNTAGTITITPFVRIDGASTANVYMQAACDAVPAGTAGLSGQTGGDTVSGTIFAVPSFSGANPHWEITQLNQTLTVAAGDVVTVYTRRVGSSGSDTFTGYLDLKGWKIAYS